MVSEDFAKFFSEVVRLRRKERELSQEALAEKANVSSKMVSLIERGERTPSITVARSIAEGLSVPLWRLIKDAEVAQKERFPPKRRRQP